MNSSTIFYGGYLHQAALSVLNGVFLVSQEKLADGNVGTLPARMIYRFVPVQAERRKALEPSEEAEIAKGESQWIPNPIQNESTPIANLMASPGKQGLLAGLAAGALGGAAGYGIGSIPKIGHPVAGAAIGAGLSGLVAAASKYLDQYQGNKNIKEVMRRLPAHATKRDYDAEEMLMDALSVRFGGSFGSKSAAAHFSMKDRPRRRKDPGSPDAKGFLSMMEQSDNNSAESPTQKDPCNRWTPGGTPDSSNGSGNPGGMSNDYNNPISPVSSGMASMGQFKYAESDISIKAPLYDEPTRQNIDKCIHMFPHIPEAAQFALLGAVPGVLGGGLMGMGAGSVRGKPITGTARGTVRGGMTGAGAGLGSLLAATLMSKFDPTHSGGALAAGMGTGAGLGGLLGYGAGGVLLGDPDNNKTAAAGKTSYLAKAAEAQSKAQQRLFGMVHAAQKGELKAPSRQVANMAKKINQSSVDDFASTDSKKLPNHVKKAADKPALLCKCKGNQKCTKCVGSCNCGLCRSAKEASDPLKAAAAVYGHSKAAAGPMEVAWNGMGTQPLPKMPTPPSAPSTNFVGSPLFPNTSGPVGQDTAFKSVMPDLRAGMPSYEQEPGLSHAGSRPSVLPGSQVLPTVQPKSSISPLSAASLLRKLGPESMGPGMLPIPEQQYDNKPGLNSKNTDALAAVGVPGVIPRSTQIAGAGPRAGGRIEHSVRTAPYDTRLPRADSPDVLRHQEMFDDLGGNYERRGFVDGAGSLANDQTKYISDRSPSAHPDIDSLPLPQAPYLTNKDIPQGAALPSKFNNQEDWASQLITPRTPEEVKRMAAEGGVALGRVNKDPRMAKLKQQDDLLHPLDTAWRDSEGFKQNAKALGQRVLNLAADPYKAYKGWVNSAFGNGVPAKLTVPGVRAPMTMDERGQIFDRMLQQGSDEDKAQWAAMPKAFQDRARENYSVNNRWAHTPQEANAYWLNHYKPLYDKQMSGKTGDYANQFSSQMSGVPLASELEAERQNRIDSDKQVTFDYHYNHLKPRPQDLTWDQKHEGITAPTDSSMKAEFNPNYDTPEEIAKRLEAYTAAKNFHAPVPGVLNTDRQLPQSKEVPTSRMSNSPFDISTPDNFVPSHAMLMGQRSNLRDQAARDQADEAKFNSDYAQSRASTYAQQFENSQDAAVQPIRDQLQAQHAARDLADMWRNTYTPERARMSPEQLEQEKYRFFHDPANVERAKSQTPLPDWNRFYQNKSSSDSFVPGVVKGAASARPFCFSKSAVTLGSFGASTEGVGTQPISSSMTPTAFGSAPATPIRSVDQIPGLNVDSTDMAQPGSTAGQFLPGTYSQVGGAPTPITPPADASKLEPNGPANSPVPGVVGRKYGKPANWDILHANRMKELQAQQDASTKANAANRVTNNQITVSQAWNRESQGLSPLGAGSATMGSADFTPSASGRLSTPQSPVGGLAAAKIPAGSSPAGFSSGAAKIAAADGELVAYDSGETPPEVPQISAVHSSFLGPSFADRANMYSPVIHANPLARMRGVLQGPASPKGATTGLAPFTPYGPVEMQWRGAPRRDILPNSHMASYLNEKYPDFSISSLLTPPSSIAAAMNKPAPPSASGVGAGAWEGIPTADTAGQAPMPVAARIPTAPVSLATAPKPQPPVPGVANQQPNWGSNPVMPNNPDGTPWIRPKSVSPQGAAESAAIRPSVSAQAMAQRPGRTGSSLVPGVQYPNQPNAQSSLSYAASMPEGQRAIYMASQRGVGPSAQAAQKYINQARGIGSASEPNPASWQQDANKGLLAKGFVHTAKGWTPGASSVAVGPIKTGISI